MHPRVGDFAAGRDMKQTILSQDDVGPDGFGSQREAVVGYDKHGCLVANARLVDGCQDASQTHIGIGVGRVSRWGLSTLGMMRRIAIQEMQDQQIWRSRA